MNIQNGSKHTFSILSLLVSLVLITGCLGYDATLGDQIRVSKSFKFYLASGPSQHVQIPKEAYEFILTEPIWSVSDGLILEKAELDLVPTTITWTSGNTRYEVSGLELSMDVSVRVKEDANAGEEVISVDLPGLPEVATVLGGFVTLKENTEGFDHPNRFKATITVHNSAFEKYTAIGLKWVMVAVVAVVVLIILGALSSFSGNRDYD